MQKKFKGSQTSLFTAGLLQTKLLPTTKNTSMRASAAKP